MVTQLKHHVQISIRRLQELPGAWRRSRLWIKAAKTFQELDLSQRFMLASLVILLSGMIGIGAWVEHQVELGVVNTTGATTALYVDSFISPLLQDFDENGLLLPEQTAMLDRVLTDTPMGSQLVAFRIWSPRGLLLFDTFDAAAIGRVFPMSDGLLRARLGKVVSSISTLDEVENATLGAVHPRLLETYSPIYRSGSAEVTAVAEFYQRTDEMEQEIGVLKRRSWFVVGAALLVVYLLLAGFVRTSSDLIEQQRAELQERMVQNRELSDRVRRASASVAQLNEGYLRRIGSELHDGPVQYLSLSLLRLDALAGRLQKPGGQLPAETAKSLAEIETTLQSALKEMRATAGGLSLPQLASLDLAETVIRAVRAHERQTGTRVELDLGSLPENAALPLKITAYRIIQEALNNAFRHAGGLGQQVYVGSEGEELRVEISDAGPGFDPEQAARSEGRLGLAGMRERVESLGGRFQVTTAAGQGTQVAARLPCHLNGEES